MIAHKLKYIQLGLKRNEQMQRSGICKLTAPLLRSETLFPKCK